MPEALEYSKETFAEGETAFARGIPTAQLVDQLNIETADPNAKEYGKDGISDEQYKRWTAEQDQRMKNGIGLVLGYLNGIAQAIRRIDNQMSLPR